MTISSCASLIMYVSVILCRFIYCFKFINFFAKIKKNKKTVFRLDRILTDIFVAIFETGTSWCIYFRRTLEALDSQAKQLWHTTNIYMHPKIHEYAEKLTDKLPGDLKVNIQKICEAVFRYD